MDEPRSSAQGPLIAFLVVAALLAAYIASYYLMGRVGSLGPMRLHVYPYRWQAVLFKPAAKVESILVGREVVTAHRE